ncbi:MAG TPA: beta-N-acetylglucosaminidase domain-containing protein [Rhizomicrobium sp.]
MTAELGIIEGFYGRVWSWAARQAVVSRLAPRNYRFYIYAPKADLLLREHWQQEHPREEAEGLAQLSAHCRANGVRFGVGLSPYEIYRNFDDAAKAALGKKLAWLDAIGIDDLAILFDDMRGDLPKLAETQATIVHWARDHSKATRIVMCPSYYTDDPNIDRFFGQRPENYLEDLGKLLDPAVEVFWTGEETCAREFSPGHLRRVAQQIGRKPFLWDNYPVNDGPRMSQHLHLRAFTGRPASIAPCIAAHAVNPALQPILSLIPALSLADSYEQGDAYEYGAAFLRAATALGGAEFANTLQRHTAVLQETGLDLLSDDSKERLRKIYKKFDNDAAREVLAWLDGADTMRA